MLSNLTNEDCIAIFQKLSDVSFTRVLRTCKWAKQFVEDNHRKFKIHVNKKLTFDAGMWHKGNYLSITDETYSTSKQRTIPYNLVDLETIIRDRLLECFVFRQVALALSCYTRDDDDLDCILKWTAAIPARHLYLHRTTGTALSTSYNYKYIDISIVREDAIVPIFDLAKMHRDIRLHLFMRDPPVEDAVGRCCELIQGILEDKVVTQRLRVTFRMEMDCPVALDRSLKKKGGETIVLIEGMEFYIIRMSESSFLVVAWVKAFSGNSVQFDICVIRHRAAFYDLCFYFIDEFLSEQRRIPSADIPNLPVVQAILDRFSLSD